MPCLSSELCNCFATSPSNLVATRSSISITVTSAPSACASCTHENYLRGTLDLPAFDGEYLIVDPKVVTYTVEGPGLDAVDAGQLDGFLCSEQVGERAIADGLRLERIDVRLFTELATGWIDKSSELDVEAFVHRVDQVVRALHDSGRLRQLSEEFFGTDYVSEAAAFDMASIEQEFR